MSHKIGMLIGLVEDNFELTNAKDEKVQLRLKFDFRSATDADIKSWLCGNRRIAFQRPGRSLSKDELKALDGTTIIAQSAGRKVQSRADRIAQMVAQGIPEKLAIVAIDNPVAFATAMDAVDIEPETPDTDEDVA